MSETLHSSQIGRFQPLPKTVLGRTRADEKTTKDNAEKAAEAKCYRLVDKRDGLRCRVTGQLLSLRGGLTTKVYRHHLIERSQGGPHETWNVLTVSKATHDEIHVKGTLRLFGNADLTDERGKRCGVKVERQTEAGWVAVGMV